MAQKIQMTTPIVEMDGDEMTRILWKMIKDELILPFVDLKTEYYDLGLKHRNETDDRVTVDAAKASSKLLLPICIMFIGILIMIMVPIFSNLGV